MACVLSVIGASTCSGPIEPEQVTFIEDRRLPDGRIERVIRRKVISAAPGDGEVTEVRDRAEAERDG